MSNTKTLATLEKIKACAIMLVGIAIAGSTIYDYASTGSLQRMPRILLPVYDVIGALGVTIATCVIGLLLVLYGRRMWVRAGKMN